MYPNLFLIYWINKGENMVFYLKVNREEPYTYNNLQQWINSIRFFSDYKIYILCDKKSIKEEIVNRIDLYKNEVEFIESNYSNEAIDIVKSFTCETKWEKAGIAHLTTFLHARDNDIEKFWNIDADDTLFCIPPERLALCLNKAGVYADENQIHLFALDMWVSRWTDLWSFGIVYCDNKINWVENIKRYCNGLWIKENNIFNIDRLLGYIKKQNLDNCRIESFYYENLKFIHYSNDFIKRPVASGLYHFKDGKIFAPILYFGFGLKDIGLIPIDKDVIKFDISITDEESKQFIINYGMEASGLEVQFKLFGRD